MSSRKCVSHYILTLKRCETSRLLIDSESTHFWKRVELQRSRRAIMNQNTTRSMVLSRRVCLRLLLNRNGKNSTLKVSLLTEEWKWFRERVGTTRRNNLVFRETVVSTHQVQEGNSSVPFCCHRNWLLVYREIPFDERCLPRKTL